MEKTNEIWKDIKGYEGYYQASNFGRIKNIKTGRILKQMPQGKANRLFVGLSKDGKTERRQVSRIIAETFIPNPDNLPQVNHKDENTQNNKVDNLEWCDAKYNINYGTGIERRARQIEIPVSQYTLSGEFIRTWRSATYAAKVLGFRKPGNISSCCTHHKWFKTAYGYKWEYAN